MTFRIALICTFVLVLERPSHANVQSLEENSAPKFTFGLNLAELTVFYGMGAFFNAAYDNEEGGAFLPFHFNGANSINSRWGVSWGLVFRHDDHSTFLNYQEWIGLIGFRYSIFSRGLLGPYLGLRAGYGFASGNINSTNQELYSCSEFAAQPEIGTSFSIAKGISASVGGGLLIIQPLTCQNEVQWSTIGILVHRRVPVLDFTLGFAL